MAAYGFTCLSAFYSAVLLLALGGGFPQLSSFLKAGFLKYFGKVSYGVYIFHQGIHALVYALLPKFRTGAGAIREIFVITLAVSFTLLLAEVSWRMIESKLISRAHVRYKY